MIRVRLVPILLLCSLVAAACGDSDDGSNATAAVSGDAIPFNYSDRRIEGATVYILEFPDKRVVTGSARYDAFYAVGNLECEYGNIAPFKNILIEGLDPTL